MITVLESWIICGEGWSSQDSCCCFTYRSFYCFSITAQFRTLTAVQKWILFHRPAQSLSPMQYFFSPFPNPIWKQKFLIFTFILVLQKSTPPYSFSLSGEELSTYHQSSSLDFCQFQWKHWNLFTKGNGQGWEITTSIFFPPALSKNHTVHCPFKWKVQCSFSS